MDQWGTYTINLEWLSQLKLFKRNVVLTHKNMFFYVTWLVVKLLKIIISPGTYCFWDLEYWCTLFVLLTFPRTNHWPKFFIQLLFHKPQLSISILQSIWRSHREGINVLWHSCFLPDLPNLNVKTSLIM